MGADAEPAAEDVFGPAVIFTALMEARVSFHFVGFVTHYAQELYERQHPVRPPGDGHRPRSHVENRNRLAHALRTLGAALTENGTTELFTGDGSAFTGREQVFRTPHGDVSVSVHTPTADEAVPGLDPLTAGVRISIIVSTARLRSYAATGKFPGLDDVLKIVEAFREDGDLNRRRP